MNFEQVDDTQFADIFGKVGTGKEAPSFSVASALEEEVNIFGGFTEKSEEGTPTDEKPDDEKTEGEETGEEEKEGEEKPDETGETDILGEAEKAKAGRKPKYEFSDINGYFQDRIKSNKLIGLIDQDDKPIELKTPEDFDLVIEQNINYQVEQKAKELEENWYKGKSQAWQVIAHYANLVEDPSQVIPFLQGVKNIQSVSKIDESTIDGAEAIVRYYKQRSNTPADIIDDEIDSLKTSDKLISAAGKLKPALLQAETVELQKMQQEAKDQELAYWKMVEENEKSARSAISAPLFGSKIKIEEQSDIYNMIAVPNEELGGYAIYNEIDKLYQNKNFDTLKKIAYLLKNEDNFIKVASQNAITKTANDIQRTVRLATSPKASSAPMDDPNYQAPQKIKMGGFGATFGKAQR
jgi:hypothetical protein